MVCLLLVVRNVNSYHNINARACLRAFIVSVSVGGLCDNNYYCMLSIYKSMQNT